MYYKIDESLRVMLLGADERLRRTFISAVVSRCITGVMQINGRLIKFSPVGKENEISEDTQSLKNSMQAFEYLGYFMIDDAFRDRNKSSGKNELSLGISVNGDPCGRLDFFNITDNTLAGIENLEKSDLFTVIVLLDAQRITENDTSDQGYFIEGMKRALSRFGNVHVFLAVGRTERFFKESGSYNVEKLFELTRSGYPLLYDFLEERNIPYDIRAYSASNKKYELVFDENGDLLKAPDYEPWGIDELVRDMLFRAACSAERMISMNREECIAIINERSVFFNRGNVRAVLDVKNAKKMLFKMAVEAYPINNAKKYFEPPK